jgi:hypothetical protein
MESIETVAPLEERNAWCEAMHCNQKRRNKVQGCSDQELAQMLLSRWSNGVE